MQNRENSMEPIPFRPLGLVKTALENLAVEITYVYEDLIFIKHNHFLLQFGEQGEQMSFYRNQEIDPGESEQQFAILVRALSTMNLQLSHGGSYVLTEQDDGTMSLIFSGAEHEE